MLSIAVIIWLAFIALSYAEEPGMSNLNNLVDNLVNRALEVQPLHQADLDSMALAKPGHLQLQVPRSQLAAPRSRLFLAPSSRLASSHILLPLHGSHSLSFVPRLRLPPPHGKTPKHEHYAQMLGNSARTYLEERGQLGSMQPPPVYNVKETAAKSREKAEKAQRKAERIAAARQACKTTVDEAMQMVYFFRFYATPFSTERVDELVEEMDSLLRPLGVLGTVYVATEGLNAQLAVPVRQLDTVRQSLSELDEFALGAFGEGPRRSARKLDLNYGASVDEGGPRPFKKLVVKPRPQVLTDGLERPLDWQWSGAAVSPEEWDDALKDESALLLDCRNTYEYTEGRFVKRNAGQEPAESLETEAFTESWDALRKRLADVPKGTPIMTYCTGGIRCTKVNAFLEQDLGFNNTKWLKDGIVGYLRHKREQGPERVWIDGNFVFARRDVEDDSIGQWKGNNFMFDRRAPRTTETKRSSLADAEAQKKKKNFPWLETSSNPSAVVTEDEAELPPKQSGFTHAYAGDYSP